MAVKRGLKLPEITIYAAEISTFGRIVAMVAVEKEISWTLVPTVSSSAEHVARHPFGKTPAVAVNGHLLIESDAICRYLDDVFDGVALVPDDPLERAEMTKWMAFVQAYMFPTTEFGLVMPRLIAPLMGREVDENRVQKSLPTIQYQLALVEQGLADRAFIASDRLTLADIYLFCTWMAVAHTAEGKVMLHHSPNVSRWMGFISSRESARATAWSEG
jgi:glutathione S-transferase